MHAQHRLPPPSVSVHVNGLPGIRDRCKPEVEIQSRSVALAAEGMSRLGLRLGTSRLPLQPRIHPIDPLLD